SARPFWQTANMSSNNPPDLHMLNVVVGDMAASLDFYRRLGIAVPAPGDGGGAHVQLKMPGGFSLELDTAESARLWHGGWRAGRLGSAGGTPPVGYQQWVPLLALPGCGPAGKRRVTALAMSDYVCENSWLARCLGGNR